MGHSGQVRQIGWHRLGSERYPEVHYGFAFAESPIDDKAAAVRRWERLFALYGRRWVGPEEVTLRINSGHGDVG